MTKEDLKLQPGPPQLLGLIEISATDSPSVKSHYFSNDQRLKTAQILPQNVSEEVKEQKKQMAQQILKHITNGTPSLQ